MKSGQDRNVSVKLKTRQPMMRYRVTPSDDGYEVRIFNAGWKTVLVGSGISESNALSNAIDRLATVTAEMRGKLKDIKTNAKA